MKSILAVTAAALALGFSLSAVSAPLPAPRAQGGITYLTGGIGRDEAAAMKAEAKRYPLSIVLSEGRSDAYVAGARVTIADAGGKTVLDAKPVGPILLVRLPAGRYRIRAVAGGKTLQREAQVSGAGAEQVVLHWAAMA